MDDSNNLSSKVLSPLSALLDEIEAQSGLIINFHDLSGLSLQIPSLKLRQEQHYHHGAYCSFAKQHGNLGACTRNKAASIERARQTPASQSFSGYCPFGIWDHAQPLWHDHALIGIIYAGSLMGARPLAAVNGKMFSTSDGHGMPVLTPTRQRNCQEQALFVAQHIQLLIGAWLRHGNLLGKKKSEHFYLQAMQQYIETHYHRAISLQSFAEQLRVHPNYLGALISTQTGRSFRQHLLAQRCRRAQLFLTGDNSSITQIAYSCGFQDSNYFSTAFKRYCGLSPRQFRQQQQQQ